MTALSRWVNFKVSFFKRSLVVFLSGMTKEEHQLINDLSVGSSGHTSSSHICSGAHNNLFQGP